MTEYSAVPAELRDIFAALEDEIVWIHGRWAMYRQLFGTNEGRVRLLNETAPTFFAELQFLWLDYIVLEICRITDPHQTIAGRKKYDNLVLEQLLVKIDKSEHSSLAAKLEASNSIVRERCRLLRDRRNRKVAHLGLAAALGVGAMPVPGVSRQIIEDALAGIRGFMNTFREAFLGSRMAYEEFVMLDDATRLISNLKRAAVYRLLEESDHSYRIHLRDAAGKYS